MEVLQKETWVLRDERPEWRVCQRVCVCRGEKQAGWVSAQEAGNVCTNQALLWRLDHRRHAASELHFKATLLPLRLKTITRPPRLHRWDELHQPSELKLITIM